MGKPLAGQLGQMGSPTQSQMGGGFGGSQPQLRQPALESPYNGSGGGGMQLPGMGAFQDFMRQQQQASQMPQQPAYGGFGNGMGINIAQPPQQSGGLLGSLSPQQPQQNPGGFGNQQLLQALQNFTSQQQPQQAPQMPMIGPGGGGNLDFYARQMQPPTLGQATQSQMPQYLSAQMDALRQQQQQMSQQAPQQPMQQTNPMQSQMDALRQQQQMSQQAPQPPTLGQATQSQMQQPQQAAQAQQIYALNQQLQAQGRPGMLGFSPDQMQQSLNQVGAQSPQPQMPLRAPQQVRPEPPRMQAMRGIQQLASRQRGYNR
jgi:hypothetical protein